MSFHYPPLVLRFYAKVDELIFDERNGSEKARHSIQVFKMPLEEVLRARTLSETRGFLKALVEVDGGRILGFAGFAVDAGEIMGAVQIAMIAGLTHTALRE